MSNFLFPSRPKKGLTSHKSNGLVSLASTMVIDRSARATSLTRDQLRWSDRHGISNNLFAINSLSGEETFFYGKNEIFSAVSIGNAEWAPREWESERATE